MSKSFGNIIPLRQAIRDHSADTIRVALLSSAELLQDADFSFEALRGIRFRLDDIYQMGMSCPTLTIIAKRRKNSYIISKALLSLKTDGY